MTEDFEFYSTDPYDPEEHTEHIGPSVEYLEELIREKHYSYDKLISSLASAMYVLRNRNFRDYK